VRHCCLKQQDALLVLQKKEGKAMRELLYRPSWQRLRVSFLSANRNDGGWTTALGTRRNIESLEAYVTGSGDELEGLVAEATAMQYTTTHEHSARLYRTINCLNAVRMGNSGQGQKGSEHDLVVLDYRNTLQSRQTINYHRDLVQAAVRWDWSVVKKELQDLYDLGDMHSMFDEIEINLLQRAKAKDATKRKELFTFLLLMKEVRAGE
jgi:hypothetical protein